MKRPRRNATRKPIRFRADAHVDTMRAAADAALATDPEDWTPSDQTAIAAWRALRA